MEEEKKSIKEKITTFAEEWFVVIFMICGFAILAVTASMYYYNHSESVFSSKNIVESLGQAGDFLGGSLNPIFAFLSYCLLLITIKLQNKSLKDSQEELKLTREQLFRSANAQEKQIESLKIQNFENTLFNMINLHNEGIKHMILKENTRIHQMRGIKLSNNSGTDSFDKKIVSFYSIKEEDINLGADRDYIGKEAISRLFLILVLYQDKKGWENFKSNYPNFYEEYRNILTHYFKLMYQIFLLIEDNVEEKLQLKYVNIFKAQFTTDELNMIAFHLISNYNSTDKYIKFIEKYSFLDSISYNEYLFKIPIESLGNSSFGTNDIIISKLNEKRESLNK